MDNKNFSRLLTRAEEAKAKMHETLNDYKNNPDSFLPIDDNFWKDTEQKLIQRFKNKKIIEFTKDYPAIFETNNKKSYSVFFPDIQGCVSAGDTFEEAKTNAIEALSLHISGMIEDGEKAPISSTKKSIETIIINNKSILVMLKPDKSLLEKLIHTISKIEETAYLSASSKNSSRLDSAIARLEKEENTQLIVTSIKINKKEYTALIYIDKNNDGYNALVPDLEGCFSCGKTFEEAVEMIKEAAELYCEDEKPEIFQYKAFIGSAEYSQEDKFYFGKLEHIDDLVTYEAKTKDELEKSFQNAVDDYKKTNYISADKARKILIKAKTTRPSFKEFKQKALSNENVKKEYDLLENNGYPSISKDEARKRVSAAVEEYRSGNMKTVPYSQGMDEIDNSLNTLCNKSIASTSSKKLIP